ncbi:hypothetical protein N866_05120 [Actinotalea ferrariae CF5-4]|uniref:TIGR03089 family protein n=1 Tax=Actinotalea ferrariae CF5-4 TaxID=948458 RepID=A0A021VXJ8_9CELL|nr:hypothetical protein N866_05120 [Actinotalea ferrariae CF5-4]
MDVTDLTRAAFAPRPPAPLLPALLGALTRDPGRPRLTWYGPEGERVELSGHVLDNWVTKSTNLLVEEFEVGPRSAVVLDLPPHWRAVVWAFAIWRSGACVIPVTRAADDAAPERPGAGGGLAADRAVVVTDRPQEWSGARDVVAVALPALARRYDGDLPVGAMDASSAVMTYGDVLTFLQEHDRGADAIEVEGAVVVHDGLRAWAAEAAGALVPPDAGGGEEGPRRVLVEPGPGDGTAVLAAALTVLAADGSIVLCHPDVVVELAADPARRARLVETERVTGAQPS